VDVVVGRNANEVLVERAVVDRAKADAVADERFSLFLGIADYVGSVEQADLLGRADSAPIAIRA
jgi:hypothetical protein